MGNLAFGKIIIHVKSQFPMITVTAMIFKNSENSEKFELRTSDIRIMGNFAYGQRIIHVKSQSPVITGTAMIGKNSKNSEKFELRISNIRKVEKWKILPMAKG